MYLAFVYSSLTAPSLVKQYELFVKCSYKAKSYFDPHGDFDDTVRSIQLSPCDVKLDCQLLHLTLSLNAFQRPPRVTDD